MPRAQEPMLQVWLATEAADRRAMHDVIAIFTSAYTYVLEPAGWSSEGPVSAVLGAAGFAPAGRTGLTVREVPCDVPIVLHRGFFAPESMFPRIHDIVVRAMTGRLGGFFPVLAGQAFFHRAVSAFEYAWSAAGRPRIEVRHPHLTSGLKAEDGTPGPVDVAAQIDPRVAAAHAPPPAAPPEEHVPDPWTRGPIEGEDPGPEEVVDLLELA
ncbi:MAG: hypothetical protein R3B70_07425 [Polyangiaceae bacterium]